MPFGQFTIEMESAAKVQRVALEIFDGHVPLKRFPLAHYNRYKGFLRAA
jgi:hypothetical protein